jgi:hypothetical protein
MILPELLRAFRDKISLKKNAASQEMENQKIEYANNAFERWEMVRQVPERSFDQSGDKS